MQPASVEDVAIIAADGFRAEDERETQSAAGTSCAVSCLDAFELTDSEVYTITREGHPVGLFGVAPILTEGWPVGWAMAWILAGNGLYDVKRDFVRQCPRWINHLARYYPNLINWVHPDNKAGLLWAQWMGFELLHLEEYGVAGEQFWRAERRT